MVQTMKRRRQRLGDEAAWQIKQIARRQLAGGGSGAISLRGIAREMGMAQPSLYHYFPRLDDLITALIVDAYSSLGDALDRAQAPAPAGDFAGPADDFGGRFEAAVLAYRAWALANPAEYKLIFGNPIPGYHAPPDVTVPVVQRAFAPLASLPEAAQRHGRLTLPPPDGAASPALERQLMTAARNREIDLPPQAMRVLLEGWGQMQGLVTLELFGHLQPLVGDPEELYRAATRGFIGRIGLRPSPDAPCDIVRGQEREEPPTR